MRVITRKTANINITWCSALSIPIFWLVPLFLGHELPTTLLTVISLAILAFWLYVMININRRPKTLD